MHQPSVKPPKLRWDKLNDMQINAYQNRLSSLLSVPTSFPASSALQASAALPASAAFPASTAIQASTFPASMTNPAPTAFPASTEFPASIAFPAPTAFPTSSAFPATTALPAPLSVPCDRCHCEMQQCKTAIQSHYDFLINSLTRAAAPLPRSKSGVEKSWWSPTLTNLRSQSIEIHKLWLDQGKPHTGPIQQERLRVRASYKKALKMAQRAPKQEAWNRLHTTMASNDRDKFWKSWRSLYSKNKSHLSPVVDGKTTKKEIADSFCQTFQKNALPNDEQKVNEVNKKFDLAYETLQSSHSSNCKCDSYNITLENVVDAIHTLKMGKSLDDDGISAEHILFASFSFLTELHKLFQSMLKHSFVPSQFSRGTIVPVVKDHQGNRGDVSNYRGITISPIISKIFEHALKHVFHDFLSSCPWQFGFKKRNSTTNALYCLRQTVDYYVENGSRVFCAFLDASKAFDRLIHSGLFLKMIRNGVPKIFIDLIVYWYSNILCRVRWDHEDSSWFHMKAGVRQGGVLSPSFYSLYVDELVEILQKLSVGCYIKKLFMAAILYADDMALLAPSIKGLQLLLDHCSAYCKEWDICLNTKKSKVLYFDKRCGNRFVPNINGLPLEWVESWTYLGVKLVSAKQFGCTVVDRIKKFYKCANAIFRIEGRSDDLIMLKLVEAHCVPILTYGIETARIADRNERSKIRAAYNSIFRRIIG